MTSIINDIFTNLSFIEARQNTDHLTFSEKMLLSHAWDTVIRKLEQLETLLPPRIIIPPPPPPSTWAARVRSGGVDRTPSRW